MVKYTDNFGGIMMDNNILVKSLEQKKLADKILRDSKLLDILGKYGEATVVGSYAYDLMTAPDIDIHVIAPALTRKAVLEVFDKLMTENYFYAYNIADFYEKAKRPGIDKGYLIGLRFWTPGAKWDKRWKFDIWFFENENPHQRAIAEMITNKLTPEKRQIILSLKDWRDQYNKGIESYNIYRAVLENEVKTPEELLSYLSTGVNNH